MDDYNKLALKAVDLQKKNKSEEAKQIYIDLLKIDRNPQILRLLGLIELDEKNYDGSLKLFNESFSGQHNAVDDTIACARCYFKMNNIPMNQAIQETKKC